MKKTLRRTLAASTVAVALVATMATTPTAVAGASSQGSTKPSKLSNFGFKGTAVGAKLYVHNVQLISARDAEAPLRCSRKVGRTVKRTSVLTAPENSLIELSGATSRTETYRDGKKYGVRAINKLGDITLGDTSDSVPTTTPIVTIGGLTSTAEAFHAKGRYGHQEAITRLDLDIDLLPDSDVDDPLQDLLDAIEDGVLDEILEALEDAGAPIEIPGLGTIGLGRTKHTVSQHHAESDAKALEFVVTATGETQRLELGHARARIGGPTPGGVFRSTSMPLDVKALDSQLHFGHVKPRTIPCEGTGGKTRTKHLDSVSVALPSGLLMGAKDIDYVLMGEQRSNGRARGFEVSRVGSFEIPALELSITGIHSRVGVKGRNGALKVRTTTRTGAERILYQGEEVPVPKPGRFVELEGLGFIERAVVTSGNRWGKKVTALQVTLESHDVVIDLGNAAGHLFAY